MNTFKFLSSCQVSSETFADSMVAIRNKLFGYGVCWTDSVKGKFFPDVPFRVVLYTKQGRADFKNPLVKECNGLVFEYNDGWTLLAMPQSAFCTNKISMRRLNDMFCAGCYDVFEVLDATILTLYFYNGAWRVSSTKGYDIGDIEMVKGMTFMEAIKDLMRTKYQAFSLDSLHTSRSYTIALRHSQYHIFDETKYHEGKSKFPTKKNVDMNSYIMVMAIADLTSCTFNTQRVVGLPMQNPLNLRDAKVPLIVDYARRAYDKYELAFKRQEFKYKPLYGYILRSRSRSVPDEYSTVFIESELFKVVKSGLYRDNEALRKGDHRQLVANMAANHERLHQFKVLFEQFMPMFESLERNLDDVAAVVLRQIASEEDGSCDMIKDLCQQFKDVPDATPGIIKDAMFSKRNMHYLTRLV